MSRVSSSIFKLASIKNAQVGFDFGKAVAIMAQSAPQVIGVAATAITNPSAMGNPATILSAAAQALPPGVTQAAIMTALPMLLEQIRRNPSGFMNHPVIQAAMMYVNTNPALAKRMLIALRQVPGAKAYIDWHIKEILKAGMGASGPEPIIDNLDIDKLLRELPSPPF